MTPIYRSLSAKDALDLWAKNRKAYAAKQQAGIPLTPDEQEDLDGNMTALAQQNPDAWKLLKSGANVRQGDSGNKIRDIFNPGTGEWEQQDVKGYWSHPESWIQLAAGAGMGGLGAYAAFAGPAGEVAGGAGAFNAAGEWVPVALAGTHEAAASMAPAVVGGLGSALTSPDVLRTAIGTGGNLVGGIIQTKAAQAAADAQAAAAKYAADLQDAAAKRTEQFLREQAENQFQNSEASRHGNYDQWRARETRLSNLSATLGAGARDIPDYVPGVDPRYLPGGTTSSTTTGPGGTTTPGGPTSKTQVEPGGAQLAVDGTPASISAYFKSRGVPDTETAYWVSKWPELVARGKEINDPNYAMKRLAAADIFGGGGAAPQQPSPPAYQPTQYTPLVTGPMTPALSAPDPTMQHLAMPGSLASLAQQQKWFY